MKLQSIYLIAAITIGLILLAITGLVIYLALGFKGGAASPGGFIGFAAIIWTSIKTKLLKGGKLKGLLAQFPQPQKPKEENQPDQAEIERQKLEQQRRMEAEQAKVIRLQQKTMAVEKARFQLRKADALYNFPLIGLDTVQKAMQAKGHQIFDGANGSNGINIIGVRHHHTSSNFFDDSIVVMWKNPNSQQWEFRNFKGTTDPGFHYRRNKMNAKGTAILMEGQYPDAYKIGLHTGYQALQQCGDLTVIRDDNGDEVLDFDAELIETGNHFGINIHRSNATTESTLVNKWSAGCQVFAKRAEWDEFLGICKAAHAEHKELFTYTLLHIEDIVEAYGELEVEEKLAA